MEAPSVIAAHDPERMRVILQQHLLASEKASLRVQECRIANTRRRDGHGALFSTISAWRIQRQDTPGIKW